MEILVHLKLSSSFFKLMLDAWRMIFNSEGTPETQEEKVMFHFTTYM